VLGRSGPRVAAGGPACHTGPERSLRVGRYGTRPKGITMGATGNLKIYLTGEVRIEAGGKVIEGTRLPGRLGRLAFAYLVAERDRPVPREELAETLWGGEPPRTWEKGAAVLISRLRTLLSEIRVDGGDLLNYAYGCYQLRLPAGSWVDTAVVAQSTAEAEAALARSDFASASQSATTALDLARREFLPGEDRPWVEERRAELRRLRVRALDCLAEAQMRLGNPPAAVAAAEEAVALEPYRESGYILLMRTHAAAGNRAEALRAHEECRRLLSEELGVDPSPETESVHLEILRSKPASAAREEVASVASRRWEFPRKRAVAAPALGLVVVVALVVGIVLIGRPSQATPSAVVPGIDTVGQLSESTNAFIRATGVGQQPTGVAVTGQRIWVINYVSQTLSWLDPTSGALLGTRSVGGAPTGIAAGGGAIWVTAQFGLGNSTTGSLLRFDPTTVQPAAPLTLGDGVDAIAFGQGAVWVTNELDDTVTRIDALTGAIGSPIPVGRQPGAVAIGGDSVWVANELDSTVTRIDATTGTVTATIGVPTPTAIAADSTSVWVVSTQGGSVTRIDPVTDGVATTISVGAGPTSASIDGRSVWVALGGTGAVAHIDASSNRVVATTNVQGHPDAIQAQDGTVWVTVHA